MINLSEKCTLDSIPNNNIINMNDSFSNTRTLQTIEH